MYKVLLTTSGIGSRLGEMTKFTNKALVRIGNKPAISYIIEAYPADADFVVTLGYYGQQVRDFLELAYPKRKFTFAEVDLFEGPGSSLGYSILKAEKHLNCPFIFHASDTIARGFTTEVIDNWLVGEKKAAGANYRSYNVSHGYVTRLNEKGELNYDFDYAGIAGIFDHKMFFEKLHKLYEADPQRQSLSDVDALREMLGKVKFRHQTPAQWLDTGNADALATARAALPGTFHVLDKDDESIFVVGDEVIKFFYDKKICQNRYDRARSLDGLVPPVTGFKNNFYKYKFAEGDLLASVVDDKIFGDLLRWSKEKLWTRKQMDSATFRKACEDFYFTKTKQRIERFLAVNKSTDSPNVINGTEIPPIFDILSKIDHNWLCASEPYQFHGDFILENIIKQNGNFVLLDWRQDFGGLLDAGDIYYDLGKLNHNLIFSHDLVNKNLYSCELDEQKVQVDLLSSNRLLNCRRQLQRFVEGAGLDWKKVQTITAIIWLNMSPLHHYPLNVFLYYFGKYHLWTALESR
jgi:NDP-sugar pyrophosphorylase family protein